MYAQNIFAYLSTHIYAITLKINYTHIHAYNAARRITKVYNWAETESIKQ